MPEMWVIEGAEEGREDNWTFRLLPGAVKTVGRATRADFVVDAPLVSRFHCRLTVDERGELLVEDLESTNGTYVNDARIERATIADGDRLLVGRVQFTARRGVVGTGT